MALGKSKSRWVEPCTICKMYYWSKTALTVHIKNKHKKETV